MSSYHVKKYANDPAFPEVQHWVRRVVKEKGIGHAQKLVQKVGGYSMLAYVKPSRYPKIITACKRALEEKTYYGQHAFTIPGLRDHSAKVYP